MSCAAMFDFHGRHMGLSTQLSLCAAGEIDCV